MGVIERAVNWLRDNWHVLVGFAGTVLLTISGIVTADPAARPADKWSWAITFVIGGAFLTLVGIGRPLFRKPSYTDLVRDLDTHKQLSDDRATAVVGMFSAALHELLRVVKLLDNDTRISVYFHDDEHSEFVLLARVSMNPTLQALGRSRYPEDQGVIGKAWREQMVSRISFPVDPASWVTATELTDVPRDVAEKMQMRCRSIAACRIEKMLHSTPVSVGVIVLESLKPKALSGETIDTMQSAPAWNMLCNTIANFPTDLPSIADVQHNAGKTT